MRKIASETFLDGAIRSLSHSTMKGGRRHQRIVPNLVALQEGLHRPSGELSALVGEETMRSGACSLKYLLERFDHVIALLGLHWRHVDLATEDVDARANNCSRHSRQLRPGRLPSPPANPRAFLQLWWAGGEICAPHAYAECRSHGARNSSTAFRVTEESCFNASFNNGA